MLPKPKIAVIGVLSLILATLHGMSAAADADSQQMRKADRLNQRAIELKNKGRYSEALPMAKEALQLVEVSDGPDSEDYAVLLNNLGMLYLAMKRYAEAESLLKRSLGKMERHFGPSHLLVNKTVENLASLYTQTKNFSAAEPLMLRNLEFSERTKGPGHPDVIISISKLGLLYHWMGNFADAERMYKRSLAISEKELDPEHPDFALSLNNLAALYMDIGNYSAAEPLYLRSLSITETVSGPNHPTMSSILNNLGLLYLRMGNFTKAESFLLRSIAILENTKGSGHSELSAGLNNLASLYRIKGDYFNAESLYKRSLSILEKQYGSEHPDTAPVMNNLALVYLDSGEYSMAEPLLERCLEIWEKTVGPDHPHFAIILANISKSYASMGKYAQAMAGYMRSLALSERLLGPEHPVVAAILQNLSNIKAALGEGRSALELMSRAQKIDDKTVEQIAGFTSGDQTLQFLTTVNSGLYSYLSLVATRLINEPWARLKACEVWLRRKGLVLEYQRKMQRALIDAGDKEAADIFEELSRIRSMLSKLMFSESGVQHDKELRLKVKALEERRQALEAELSKRSQAYARLRKVKMASVDEIAAALPSGSVLVDVARTPIFNFEAEIAQGRKAWLTTRYLAFVIRPGQTQDAALVDLGAADPIDEAIAQVKAAFARGDGKPEVVRRLRKLHDAVFEPLRDVISRARRIFISPDGALNLLPFEILVDGAGNHLIETFTFNYLTAGRDLLAFAAPEKAPGKSVLLGDPDFDLNPDGKSEALDRLGVRASGIKDSGPLTGLGKLNFKRLPGTRKEILEITRLLGEKTCNVFLDSTALEEVLYLHQSPRILHLATHGFFLDHSNGTAAVAFRGVGGSIAFSDAVITVQLSPSPEMPIDNPLLRSGVALAGANLAGSAQSQGAGSDGLLTAEEVLSLPLRGTEMAVLSACETGMGEIKSSEGVFGLRRAFLQAGASSLVMSMWPVPDLETKELMVRFYQHLISGKVDRCQALRRAMLEQKEVVKRRYGEDNPFLWGAFVFLGQPQ